VDFKNLYRTKTENSFEDDRVNILETFKELFRLGKTDLQLLNYYKGLPLSFPATILAVKRDFLYLAVQPQQALAFERERNTFIRCKTFRHDICACIEYVDVLKREVIMKNFFFVDILAEQRNAIRLVLDPPAETIFDVHGEMVNGGLLDISMDSAAVEVQGLPEYRKGFVTLLQFSLPNNIQNSSVVTSVPARHVATKDFDAGHLCIFSIMQEKSTDQQVSKFIFRRQVEIIRELKDASISALFGPDQTVLDPRKDRVRFQTELLRCFFKGIPGFRE
jgi:hypothetical protein